VHLPGPIHVTGTPTGYVDADADENAYDLRRGRVVL